MYVPNMSPWSDPDCSATLLRESRHSKLGCHPSLRSAPLSLASQKKRVTFSTSARVCLVLHINNYTEQEIAGTWYTQKELVQAREIRRASRKCKARDKLRRKKFLYRLAKMMSRRASKRGLEASTIRMNAEGAQKQISKTRS